MSIAELPTPAVTPPPRAPVTGPPVDPYADPPTNDRKPDVAFVSFQRWAQSRAIPKVNAWPVAPDLAVEVISPTDKMFDVFDKLREYFDGGVQQVWHVLSNVEQLHVYTSPTAVRILTRADVLAGDPVVPGFRMPVADLFPPSAPNP